ECKGDSAVDSGAGGNAKVRRDASGKVGEVAHDVDAADVGLAVGADREAFDTTVAALPDLHALNACLIVETGVGAERKGLQKVRRVNWLGEIAGIAQRVAAGKARVVRPRRAAEQVLAIRRNDG